MDLDLFSSLIRNLLHLSVTVLDEEGCRAFAAACCRLPALQDIFTADSLRQLAGAAAPACLYDLRDQLGVNALAFRAEDKTLLAGPFVNQEFMDANFRALLSAKGFSASDLPALRLYYSELPRQDRKTAADTVLAVLKSMQPSAPIGTILPVRCGTAVAAVPVASRQESTNYDAVYRRYEQENRFLRTIENGDVTHLLSAFENMNAFGPEERHTVSAIYQEPAVALAILRTLARKAAERGGASVVKIDEITQRATQSMTDAKDLYKAQKITEAMLLELTVAVRRSREQLDGLSAPVRRAAEYLRLHYAQEVSLAVLAKAAGLSAPYLSTLFRKETGRTVTEYLAVLRTEQAAQLLRESDLPIQEISSFVGYTDNNYFIKIFRRRYGMTPGEYRRQHKSSV